MALYDDSSELQSQINARTDASGSQRGSVMIPNAVSTYSLHEDASHHQGAMQLLDELRITDEDDLQVLPGGGCFGDHKTRQVPLADVIRLQVSKHNDPEGALIGFIVLVIAVGGLGFGASFLQHIVVKLFEKKEEELGVEAFVPFTTIAIVLVILQRRNIVTCLKMLWNHYSPACMAFYTVSIDFAGNATESFIIPLPNSVLSCCGVDTSFPTKLADQIGRRRAAAHGISNIVNFGRLDHLVPDACNDFEVTLTSEALRCDMSPLACGDGGGGDGKSSGINNDYKQTSVVYVDDIGSIDIKPESRWSAVASLLLVAAAISPFAIGFAGGGHAVIMAVSIPLAVVGFLIRFTAKRFVVSILSKTNQKSNEMFLTERGTAFQCDTLESAKAFVTVIRKAQRERIAQKNQPALPSRTTSQMAFGRDSTAAMNSPPKGE